MHHLSSFWRQLAAPLLLALPLAAQAQTNPGVGIGTTAPDASAALEIVSADKGALLPRLSESARLGIGAPAAGLIVFQTDGSKPGFYYNAGSSAAPEWLRLTDSKGLSYDATTGLSVGTGPLHSQPTLGSPSSNSTLSGNTENYPYRGGYADARTLYLVRATDLLAAGATAGALTGLDFYVRLKGSTAPYQGFTIQLQATSDTVVPTAFPAPGSMSTVYSSTYTTSYGWNSHPFSTPFSWDGSSNLLVQVCFDNAIGNANDILSLRTTGYNATYALADNSNAEPGCELSSGSAALPTATGLPVLRFLQRSSYALPAVAGSAGQVLTQQANGSVAFQNMPWTQSGLNLYPTQPGNVAIGLTTAARTLDVQGQLGLRNSAPWDHLYLGHTGSIAALNAGGAENGLALRVGNGGTGGYDGQVYADVMRLLPNGYVGIGTTVPGGRLHLLSTTSGTADDYIIEQYGTGDQQLYFRKAGGTPSVPTDLPNGELIGGIAFGPRFNGSQTYAQSALRSYYRGDGTTGYTDLRFLTTGAERMRIDTTGNVGIGTSSPLARLHLSGVDNDGTAATLRVSTGGQTMLLDGNEMDSNGIFYLQNNSTNYLSLVRGGGRVGVGVDTPVSRLANTSINPIDSRGFGINSGSLTWGITTQGYAGSFYNTDAGPNGRNGLAVKVAATDASAGALDVSQGSDPAVVGTSLLRVQADGNVGINDSSPDYKLDVEGDINSSSIYYLNNSPMHYRRGTSTFISTTVYAATAPTGNYNTLVGAAGGGELTTGTNNTTLGYLAGRHLADADANVLIGVNTGAGLTSGHSNLFIGVNAGFASQTANGNAGLGVNSLRDVSGDENVALGRETGRNVRTGTQNLLLGAYADLSSVNSQRSRATALGYNARVDQDDALVLGSTTAAAKVGIGTVAPTTRLQVVSADNLTTTITDVQAQNLTQGVGIWYSGIRKTGSNANGDLTIDAKGSGSLVLNNNGGTGSVGIGMAPSSTYKLDVNGLIRTTGAVNTTSDARLKQDVRPISQALASVLALRGVRYTFRRGQYQEMNLPAGEQVGVLAQEVEKIYPELVSTDDRGFKAVNYAQLTPVLLEAIKELAARNAALEAQVAGQQQQLQTLAADHATLLSLQEQLSRLQEAVAPSTQARR
jgi:hypothetical protein